MVVVASWCNPAPLQPTLLTVTVTVYDPLLEYRCDASPLPEVASYSALPSHAGPESSCATGTMSGAEPSPQSKVSWSMSPSGSMTSAPMRMAADPESYCFVIERSNQGSCGPFDGAEPSLTSKSIGKRAIGSVPEQLPM